MVMGTHYVLTGRYDWISFSASLVPGFLVSNLLLLNQFPDSEADKTVDRRHLPIAIGKQASSYVYAVMALCAFGWVPAAAAIGLFPAGTLLSLLPFPLAILTIRGVIQNAEDTTALIPFLGKNVVYTLASLFLLGLGLLIAAHNGDKGMGTSVITPIKVIARSGATRQSHAPGDCFAVARNDTKWLGFRIYFRNPSSKITIPVIFSFEELQEYQIHTAHRMHRARTRK